MLNLNGIVRQEDQARRRLVTGVARRAIPPGPDNPVGLRGRPPGPQITKMVMQINFGMRRLG